MQAPEDRGNRPDEVHRMINAAVIVGLGSVALSDEDAVLDLDVLSLAHRCEWPSVREDDTFAAPPAGAHGKKARLDGAPVLAPGGQKEVEGFGFFPSAVEGWVPPTAGSRCTPDSDAAFGHLVPSPRLRCVDAEVEEADSPADDLHALMGRLQRKALDESRPRHPALFDVDEFLVLAQRPRHLLWVFRSVEDRINLCLLPSASFCRSSMGGGFFPHLFGLSAIKALATQERWTAGSMYAA